MKVRDLLLHFVAQAFAPALLLQRKLKKGTKFCGLFLRPTSGAFLRKVGFQTIWPESRLRAAIEAARATML